MLARLARQAFVQPTRAISDFRYVKVLTDNTKQYFVNYGQQSAQNEYPLRV